MIKFETIGVNYQLNAIDKAEAVRRFNDSCRICCHKGIRLDCDRCAIPFVHTSVLAAFEAAENR